MIISGPCSAESEEQLLETCQGLKNEGIEIMRAGIWKPRTRPNNFEGHGATALDWVAQVKKELNVKFAVEVANPQHVELSLKAGVDILWIGARSTVNPFTVQEIADALRGVDIPVLIKNPINPDLALWLGAFERINNVGITKLGAIHRGFSSLQESQYRNVPAWRIPIELKSKFPELPILCDPSHICGNRELLLDISQKALDLNYDGLIIESHRDPDNAWSDASQQVTPKRLGEIVRALKIKAMTSDNSDFINILEELREQIDESDRDILESLARRMSLVEKIGEYKKSNDVTIFQVNRINDIFKSRKEWGSAMNLSEDFVEELYKIVHIASVKRQTEIMSSIPADTSTSD
ncbi:MAG: bifunctional 3-deoxy-7-phosphoheptulonate synthase/chorismate mutase type II [Bacteroidetes bacterium]|nr:bifunctional 3-deoxy-7-phosphoheptulonate synthase/chorismate mutase type II [Bacteroidota bacterium]MDA1121914.1 bifunctional 3-deoxy-7-phosphoheptulonate synthase/chorismate mutase type II [Bacteroidota bacterium]